VAIAPSAALAVPSITNPGFDSGTFTGWTTFTTAGGDNPAPAVLSFDTDGDGSASNAARFNVGVATIDPGNFNFRGGGGIFQSVFVDVGGDYQFGLDVASNNAAPGSDVNADGGLYELLWDGNLIGSWTPGILGVPNGTTARGTIAGTLTGVPAGQHELRLQVTRRFLSASTLNHFADDFTIAAVPEPAALSLVALAGATGLLRRRRRA
jgi:hypothetical protein